MSNRADKYCHALTVAMTLTDNKALAADLAELRDRLASGQLQWRGGAQCQPSRVRAVGDAGKVKPADKEDGKQ